MKVICEQCQTKYNIADERVQGRTKPLRLKCKKCSAVIEVAVPQPPVSQTPPPASALEERFASSFQGKQGDAGGTPGLYDAVKKSAAAIEKGVAGAVVWFVAVGHEPIGPVSAAKIGAYQESGKVTDASLVWKEGMLDWTPLEECDELKGLLANLQVGDAPAEEPATGAATPPSLPLFTQKQGGATPLAGHGMGAFDGGGEESADMPSLAPSVAPPVASEPDIPDDWRSAMEPERASVAPSHSIIPAMITQSSRRWKVLAAIGFLAAAGAILTLVIVLSNNKPETIIEKQIVKETQVVYRDRPIGAADDVEIAQEEVAATQEIVAETKKRRVRKSRSETAEETPEERKKRLMRELAGKGDSTLKGSRSGETGASASGGDSLSQREMSAVVSKNRGGLQLCYERAMKSGSAPTDRDLKVTFNVSVGSSGMVRSVRMSGSGTGYPNLKNCLAASTKKWMFPASQGSSKVQFPIVFTPAR